MVQICFALPLFHSFTGIGKKTAWATWNSFPDLTESLLKDPEKLTLDSIHMQCLFSVMVYSKACNAAGVNETRQQLFRQGTRTLGMIPPTQQAPFQHIVCSLYQAAIVWMQSLQRQQNVPNASHWAWVKDGKSRVWSPFWTSLPELSKACALLFHCG